MLRTDAVLAANNRDTSVDAATYQSTDRRTRVGVGVGTDETHGTKPNVILIIVIRKIRTSVIIAVKDGESYPV